jgi:methylated-DNA-[protein]-cysteine S-methyltransferase
MNYHFTYLSPVGQLHLVSDGKVLTGLHFEAPQIDQKDRMLAEPSVEPLAQTAEQLRQFFQGERRDFDLPIRIRGTDFQLRAWNALNEIPYGETISYKTQAERIGSHPRAVGLANGQNPVAIIVPCHRVIGSDGKLVGYGGGLSRKRALLQFEALVCDFGRQPMSAS